MTLLEEAEKVIAAAGRCHMLTHEHVAGFIKELGGQSGTAKALENDTQQVAYMTALFVRYMEGKR